jgi:hypothetical protein
MSQELDAARRCVTDGRYKKAISALWFVEGKARSDIHEARGLLEVASGISQSSEGRVRKDAELLVGYARTALERLEQEEAVYGDAVAMARGCHYLGGHGYPLQERNLYDVVFSEDGLRVVQHRRDAVVVVAYSEIASVDVSGAGEKTRGGGFMGGGFGLTGAVEGMAIAAVLNSLTTQTSMDTVLRVQTHIGEMFFHSDSLAPEALRMSLSAAFTKLRQKDASGTPSSGDVLEKLAKLADLLERGAITREEFDKLKSDLLS